jgi:biotin carboxyl carrier protein
MKRYEMTLDGRTFDVRLLSDPWQKQVQVEVDGERFTVEIQPGPGPEETKGTARVAAEASVYTAATVTPVSKRVTAPLPGVIKSVAVEPGQRVSVGDELLVIEAMKMENAIRAAREGIIGTIHVTEGHQVAHGEPLLEYIE